MKRRIWAACLTALGMSMCMSFVMAVINVGFSGMLIFAWLRGWLIGFIVAAPLSYVLPPLAMKALTNLGIE